MFFNPQPASACFILWGRGGKADDPARSRIERAAQVFAFLLFVATDTTIALAQPGPFTTFRNSNLVFAATTLLTNGVPGLSRRSTIAKGYFEPFEAGNKRPFLTDSAAHREARPGRASDVM